MTKPQGLIAIEAEMARQPEDALRTLDRVDPIADDLASSISRKRRLLMLGMGASHAANRAVEPLYRALGIDATALPISEQLTSPLPVEEATVLLASQSGESAEILRWLKTARGGAPFGLTLDPASTLATTIPSLVAQGGAETAFAATRSLTLTVALHATVLGRLGVDLTAARHAIAHPSEPDVSQSLAHLGGVTALVTSARRLQGVAEAAALGLCELSRLPAFALEGGQLRHGPMEIMGPALAVILFRADEPDAALIAGMATAAHQAGSRVVVIDCSGQAAPESGPSLVLPKAAGLASIFACLPVMQRLMVGFAAERVRDVGTPRRSSKITRTE